MSHLKKSKWLEQSEKGKEGMKGATWGEIRYQPPGCARTYA